MKSFIRVTFQVEGIHRWKDCPFEEVAYLRHWHRHLFHFEVEMGVTQLDREIEFILLKKQLIEFCSNVLLNKPVEMSCETIAKNLLTYLNMKYGQRYYKVYVSEDGENGGGVEQS